MEASLPPLALFPAPVADVARLIGSTLAPDLVPALAEAFRRVHLGRYLSEGEAQRETGLSKRQLRYLRDKRSLPYFKSGRLITYPADDLFAWLDGRRVEAKAQAPA